MGWFNKIPEKDDIIFANIPEDKNNKTQLSGNHPIVVVSSDNQNVKVIGCTSNPKAEKYGAVRIETENNNLKKNTYAKVEQGLRNIQISDLTSNVVDKVKNGNEIRGKIK